MYFRIKFYNIVFGNSREVFNVLYFLGLGSSIWRWVFRSILESMVFGWEENLIFNVVYWINFYILEMNKSIENCNDNDGSIY